MNAVERLRLKKLRFEAACQQVLQHWQPEDLTQPRCPKCNHQSSPTTYQSHGERICYCIRCNYYFQEVAPAYICECIVPGQNKECNGCPNFQRFMEYVENYLAQME